MTLSGIIENANYPNSSASTLWQNLSWTNPYCSPGIVDGKVVQILKYYKNTNPLHSLLNTGIDDNFISTITSSVRLNHKLDFITKGLSSHATISYDNNYNSRIQRSKNIMLYNIYPDPVNTTQAIFVPDRDDLPPMGYSSSYGKYRKIYFEAGLNYERSFGDHTLSGMILYIQSKEHNPNLQYMVPRGIMGTTGRIVYNYKTRYQTELNMGYNGTENFAKGKRFGFFPSYSFSWITSEEPFFPRNMLISFLKFRASYGQVGNDKIGGDRFLYRPSSYSTQTGNAQGYFFGTVGENYNRYTGMLEGNIGNPDITWERAEKTNIGMELGMFEGKKLSFTCDYFYEYRNSILANRGTIPAIVGANLPAGNIGIMENSGIEFDFSYRNNWRKINYWFKANYTYAHNKIIYKDEALNLDNPYWKQTGNPVGQHFGLIAEGFYNSWNEVNDPNRLVHMWNNNRMQPGDLKYKDINEDGVLNQNDIVPIGYPDIPEIIYGISFGLDYKGLDLSVLFQGAEHVSAYFFGRAVYPFIKKEESAKELIKERWTQERYYQGLPINFPRLTMEPDDKTDNNFQKSTFWVRDANYLRLKNVEIGYTFSKNLVNKLKVSSLRAFINGSNLYTWLPNHAFSDQFDPETRGQNSDDMSYNHPQMKTFNLGLTVKF